MVPPTTQDKLDPKTGWSWQQHIKHAIRSPGELARTLGIPLPVEPDGARLPFPLFAPLPFVSRIQPGNLEDPLLRQIWPSSDEQKPMAGYRSDPLDESQYALSPGLLKKYGSRALMVINGTCAVHCRYCFRQNFPYQESLQSTQHWDQALDQIEADTSIDEVILSGGDPLTVVDETLADLVHRLEQIEHLRSLRIHTRLPIVIPQRVTARLVEILQPSRLAPVMVVHANHPNEIDDTVVTQLRVLAQSRVTLLNQSVLLRGVNDEWPVLVELSRRLIDCGVLPYYLHQLDPVTGSQNFHVPIDQGRELVRQMRSQLSGYMVPRYVQEQPGQPSKTVLA
ncbi:MAG: EF-P beta-lysylation protein EpmB [Mariniblastus sp.]|nr:EF-P beta-lysylation protein EpmB [Mariniblastus sp.]